MFLFFFYTSLDHEFFLLFISSVLRSTQIIMHGQRKYWRYLLPANTYTDAECALGANPNYKYDWHRAGILLKYHRLAENQCISVSLLRLAGEFDQCKCRRVVFVFGAVCSWKGNSYLEQTKTNWGESKKTPIWIAFCDISLSHQIRTNWLGGNFCMLCPF